MKSNRVFWSTFVGSVALLVLGYFGFVSTPDKTTGYMTPVVVLCLAMMAAGALGIVGGLVYGVVISLGRTKQAKPDGQ